MLRDRILAEKPEEEELKSRLKAARDRLAARQMKIKEHRLPVLVLLEGWGTSGKGSTIGQVIRNIDPRFFKVASMEIICSISSMSGSSWTTATISRKKLLCRYPLEWALVAICLAT